MLQYVCTVYDIRGEKAEKANSHRCRLNIFLLTPFFFLSFFYFLRPPIYIDYGQAVHSIRVQLTRVRTHGQKSRVR